VSINSPLRILHLEDDPDFSEVVKSLLEREGLVSELVLVSNRAHFEATLGSEAFDVILADYQLPDYNGLDALKLARARCPDTPILLVSGTIGEGAAIESLKSGATDYVLKLWPERLAPAVRRAVQEAEEKRERRQAESELLRREKYFCTLTENSLDILTVLNREGVCVYSSPSLKQVLGFDQAELVGRDSFSLVHPADAGRARAAFEEALQHPERSVRAEFRSRHRDGSWRFLETVGQSHIDDPAIAGVVINCRDVSDRKRLEDQLRQAQKMEAIGQLAGGVAHDFNNILTVIHGHASLLQVGANLSGDPARSAQQIVQAAERASSLTRQLLTFSRRQVMQPKALDLNEVVGNMAKMLARVLGEDVPLELSYFAQPAVIQADASMIEQVLMNLAVNARDAMPKGGSLTVKVETVQVDPDHVAGCPEARPGRFVRLTVADTGCGISPEDLPRIFEPFFTTKAVGKGTGLGLATVYGIVQQHQGWIEVESQLAGGTRFRVFLPASPRSADPSEQPQRRGLVRGGRETILVVEDEAPVRELVCKFLAGYGYNVVQAESGAKALELWQGAKDRIDLLLTDLVMPDRINGRELAETLWNDRPRLKVIFTSGYSADVVGEDFFLRHGLNYLQKPYPPQKLALLVRESLDAAN